MRFVPFSYFCTCWNVRLSASPSFIWDIPSIKRRMRTRWRGFLRVYFRPAVGEDPFRRIDLGTLCYETEYTLLTNTWGSVATRATEMMTPRKTMANGQ
jgi:hypothetical protein